MGKISGVTSRLSEMSSFQNFFNEDFLLSSTLKPKSLNGSSENIAGTSKSSLKTSGPVISDEKIKVNPTLSQPDTKRVCVRDDIPRTSTALNTKSSTAYPPIIAEPRGKTRQESTQAMCSLPESNPKFPTAPSSVSLNTAVPVNSNNNLTPRNTQSPIQPIAPPTSAPSPQSLSDQILQARIKLQIYQKEYAHFVDCANRSSSQIQETLEELHRLVNLNFDLEPLKVKGNEISPVSSTASVQNLPLAVPRPVPPPDIQIISVKHRPRFFPRKPRCLLFNPTQPSYADLMITSSLDGFVQLWSKSEQKIHSSIYLPAYLHKPFFVEDLCWDRKPTGLLAIGLCESGHVPISEDGNGPYPNRSDRQIAFLQFNNHKPLSVPKFIGSSLAPHDRNISVIENWSSSKQSGNVSNFLTGGMDKAIFSWKIVNDGSSDPEISVRELHRRHTSSVQAICYDWNTSDIWSGGTDCRIIQWSGEENRIVNEFRWDTRISHLIKTKNHPNLMLATVMSMSSQLRLYDYRINSLVHSFGTQETANLSRYVRPSWHIDGNLIASGTVSPADTVGSIKIWDLRMMRPHNTNIKPVKTINCDDRRIVRAEFSPDGHSLVGISTDGSITFVEF